jgi:cell wall assembly regulator SMI1
MPGMLATLRQQLASLDDSSTGRGATPAAIAESESILGVAFPAVLREYLRDFGYLSIRHHELFGLGEDVPSYLHMTTVVIEERTRFSPRIPAWLLPIENNGAGDHYCLDLSTNSPDPRILFWSHEQDESQSPEVVCASFSEWLSELAAGEA